MKYLKKYAKEHGAEFIKCSCCNYLRRVELSTGRHAFLCSKKATGYYILAVSFEEDLDRVDKSKKPCFRKEGK